MKVLITGVAGFALDIASQIFCIKEKNNYYNLKLKKRLSNLKKNNNFNFFKIKFK